MTEEALLYDLSYVSEHLLPPGLAVAAANPAETAAADGEAGPVRSLKAHNTINGSLTDPVVSIALDHQRELVHTTVSSGVIATFTMAGQVRSAWQHRVLGEKRMRWRDGGGGAACRVHAR